MTSKSRGLGIKTVLLILLLVAPHAETGATSKKPRWWALRHHALVTFDWNCATPGALPKKKLKKAIARLIAREGHSVTPEGDRAFQIQLFQKGPMVYCIPVGCGATGNCTWGLYTVSPNRFLGTIHGQYIYTYTDSHEWPIIATYGHISASEGDLRTFVYRNDRYHWCGDSLKTDEAGLNGKPRPKFLDTARKLCRDYGN